ncbi:MAG: STAS domain-containing protein [Verrucomicrobia bacterium]|nr:STAS domain-containing protein [Verrucomicrobiota bacterium]
MSAPHKPTFLVNAHADPVAIRIQGKANYLNCGNFRDFIDGILAKGHSRFVFDLEACRGMDSTFLGILAGLAIELRDKQPNGTLLLCNLSSNIRELLNNLGLDTLLFIDSDLCGDCGTEHEFTQLKNQEIADAREVLKAHESLIEANQDNAAQFEDVISFLRSQVDRD